MSDLIERQKAIDALNNILADYVPYLYGVTEAIPLDCAVAIQTLPSARQEPLTIRVNHELTKGEYEKLMHDIKDAPIVLLPSAQPEIIRCKDCHFYRTDRGWNGEEYKTCRRYAALREENDFCSYAERRDDFSQHMNPPE